MPVDEHILGTVTTQPNCTTKLSLTKEGKE